MRLFLTSTGINPEIRQFFLSKLPSSPEQLTVAFIPTAADPDDNKWYVDAAYNQLIDLKFKIKSVDLKDNPLVVKTELLSSDIIYINGGNTFYLLDWIRKSHLDQYLKDILNQGKIYIGGSAGAVVAGPDIAVAGWSPNWDKNIVDLVDTTGLNLVPFVISPHFNDTHKLVLSCHPDYKFPIIPISDTQAVYYEDGKHLLIG